LRAQRLWAQALLEPTSFQPEADENRDGLGDATLGSDPFANRARIHPEMAGGCDLGEAETRECLAQLLGGHRHYARIGPSGRPCKIGPVGLSFQALARPL
jgi:hypothetical protein